MPLRPGYMANTAQRAVVTVFTVNQPSRLVEGMLRDGGKVQIGINEIGPSFRWPKTGELWTVQRQGVHWRLGERVRTENELNIEQMQEGELRLDSALITDGLGRRILNETDLADQGGTGDDVTYVHTQVSPLATWTITHNLGKFPSVTVVDQDNLEVLANVGYPDINTVTVTFSGVMSGKAFLN